MPDQENIFRAYLHVATFCEGLMALAAWFGSSIGFRSKAWPF